MLRSYDHLQVELLALFFYVIYVFRLLHYAAVVSVIEFVSVLNVEVCKLCFCI
jgi:hypothetical protein